MTPHNEHDQGCWCSQSWSMALLGKIPQSERHPDRPDWTAAPTTSSPTNVQLLSNDNIKILLYQQAYYRWPIISPKFITSRWSRKPNPDKSQQTLRWIWYAICLSIDPLDQQMSKQSWGSSPALIPMRSLQHCLLAFSTLGGLARLKDLLPFKWSNLSIAMSPVGVNASFKHHCPKLCRRSVCIMEYCLLIPQDLIATWFACKTGSSLYTRPQGMRIGQHPRLVLFADYSSDK